MRNFFAKLRRWPRQAFWLAVLGLLVPAGAVLADNYFPGKVGIGTTAPAYPLQVNGDIYANGGWVRVAGSKGLYFQSYGGGWYMSDSTWIRTYGSKNIYQNAGILRTDGTLQVGSSGSTIAITNGGNLAYRTNVLFANTAGRVGVGTNAPSGQLDVHGTFYKNYKTDTANREFIIGSGYELDGTTHANGGFTLYQRWGDGGYGANGWRMVYGTAANPVLSLYNSNVGIGNFTPKYDLDVTAKTIKLGLEENGGGQLILASNPNDNKIYLEGFSSDANSSASEMLLTGRLSAPIPQITLKASTTYASGNIKLGGSILSDGDICIGKCN